MNFMNFKKLFFITKCFVLCIILTNCAGSVASRTSSSYFESDEYFAKLYATQNYTPAQKRVISTGKEQIGTPYVFGGTSPRKGLDCSGFTQYVYKNALGISLPRTAREQSTIGQFIPQQYILPGDLVFLDLVGDRSHVGIYIGDGKFFHASTSRKRLMVADLYSPYFRPKFDSAVRVIRN
jgi:cell wall-associated NlpC family hydrolase